MYRGWAWLALGLVFWSGVASAADEYPFDDDYPFETIRLNDGELQKLPHMKLGENAAPWLPKIIAELRANRPPRDVLRDIALFPDERDGVYLVTGWKNGRDMGGLYVDFHRIVKAEDGRPIAKFVRKVSRDYAYYAYLDALTGLRLSPGGASVVVVHDSSGGMDLSQHTIKFIQLRRNTVDITPDWAGRIDGFVDLDKDQKYEVVVYDDRWRSYFHGRSAAGPNLVALLGYHNGRFYPACKQHASAYRRLAALYAGHAANPKVHPVLRSEAYSAEILALAQIGAIAEAREALAAFDAFYRSNGEVLEGLTADRVHADFAESIKQAEPYAKLPCAVSATTMNPTPHGALERVQKFIDMGPK